MMPAGLRLVATVILLASMSFETQASYTGKVWLAWPQDEREQFVSGYLAYSVETGAKTFGGRLPGYEREAAAHLRKVPSVSSMEMAEIIRLVDPRVERPSQYQQRTGERSVSKYGLFDGFYWTQALGEHRLRVKFLEGYLYGLRRDPKAVARFSKSADTYARLVDVDFEKDFSKPVPDLNAGIGEIRLRFKDK